ncbi:hypothetical protein M9H77_37109 [Catharanthus roseus]|uniref:Uncharacterized protein n=1 Tax=Catharanthus roseus TaxID=4058 RepID=A0ACB9ZVM2_CATRO|nr:hypothetical protein M9H77_37109 [Catharanthus roseus]
MASSSIANLLSFFAPPKSQPLKTPAPPSQVSFSAVSSSSSSSRSKDGLAAPQELLSLTNENQQFPAITSSSELMSVVCPSLAYSNTLFFRSAYNVQVIVDDNEPEEKLLNRFRREVMRAGVIQECKRRRFYENKQDEKKRKSREAAKRNRRRRPQMRNGPPDRQETSKSKKEDDDEDNWELPVGDLPY